MNNWALFYKKIRKYKISYEYLLKAYEVASALNKSMIKVKLFFKLFIE